jgi:poly [ADP-ribose] polymerase
MKTNIVQTYINQGKQTYNPVLYAAYKVRRWPEVARFEPHRRDNVKLLWHGSPTSNFIGILSQGLRIAPPEAPSTGCIQNCCITMFIILDMFGKGIYFADAWAKSAPYCRSEGVSCMLLAQVALGEVGYNFAISDLVVIQTKARRVCGTVTAKERKYNGLWKVSPSEGRRSRD